METTALIDSIKRAFAKVEYPGDWCLRDSNEGDEPYLLEKEFAGKSDWRSIPAAFLDQAPKGFSSALSFFSDEAFRFYLPAYLIADLENGLETQSPVFHLTTGLTHTTRRAPTNPRRYGQRTLFDDAVYRMSVFDAQQVEVIIQFLEWRAEVDEFDRQDVEEALAIYWKPRLMELRGGSADLKARAKDV